MSKAPRTGFRASLSPAAIRGRAMAYAGNSDAIRMMGEAMSRLELSRDELAKLLKCPESALLTASIASDPEIADKLRDLLAVLTRLSEWTKNDQASLAWYRDETIPAFGQTASDVVADGHAAAVLQYLDSLAVGGFA